MHFKTLTMCFVCRGVRSKNVKNCKAVSWQIIMQSSSTPSTYEHFDTSICKLSILYPSTFVVVLPRLCWTLMTRLRLAGGTETTQAYPSPCGEFSKFCHKSFTLRTDCHYRIRALEVKIKKLLGAIGSYMYIHVLTFLKWYIAQCNIMHFKFYLNHV